MSQESLGEYRKDFQKAIDHLHDELKTLRTGRATPALVEGIQVDAYGTKTPIVGLASITTPDSRTVQIEPWDKGVVQGIEKAIQEARIGINPTVAGTVIRLSMPPLTEESRRELLKVMGDKLEHTRISIRNVRDRAKAEILEMEKEKLITEDDKYRQLEQLDKITGEWNDQVKQIGEDKEKEIMTI
jgi:ribosome recycling factor